MSTKTKDLLKSYSGIFGNQVVLRNRNGKIIMTIQPPKPEKKPTEKQIAWRRKFQVASLYATTILKDPVRRAAYTLKLRKGLTTYNLALKDYLKTPVILKIDVSGYHGKPGEKISVTASYDFPLEEVSVRIVDASGSMAEKGVCTFSLPTGTYDYTATTLVPDLPGVTVIAAARNMPGHVTELTASL